jgi:hypothetical protein
LLDKNISISIVDVTEDTKIRKELEKFANISKIFLDTTPAYVYFKNTELEYTMVSKSVKDRF